MACSGEKQRVTVDRRGLMNVNGSTYIPLPAALRRSAGIPDDAIVAYDRDVLPNGELGELTMRIESSSELKKEPPRSAN
jgi:hypothetical protein